MRLISSLTSSPVTLISILAKRRFNRRPSQQYWVLPQFINLVDLYLIFDLYFKNSIKSDTKLELIRTYQRSHKLVIRTPQPPKEICMSSTKMKENLIKIVSSTPMERSKEKKIETKLLIISKKRISNRSKNGSSALREMCPHTEFFLVRIFPHSDWIRRYTKYFSVFSPNAGKYGPEKTPFFDTFHAVRIKRKDLETLFDEADYIIPYQVNCFVKEKHPLIRVICSDTGVFVLLYTMYIVKNWSGTDVYMEDFIGEKSLKSIKKAVEKHKDFIHMFTVGSSYTNRMWHCF